MSLDSSWFTLKKNNSTLRGSLCPLREHARTTHREVSTMAAVKNQVTEPSAEELTQEFYNALGKWIDGGFPPSSFSQGVGLCGNFLRYDQEAHGLHTEILWEIRSRTMIADFRENGMCNIYPFNESSGEYEYESDNLLCYKNPNRIRWVQDHRNDHLPNHETPN